MASVLAIWNRFKTKPFGRHLFSRIVCRKAPYFGSIQPLFVELQPEKCIVRMRKRRAVLNHIGTVHAIAMCNMAELAAGTMTDVTVPETHRWIPKGMSVEYLNKATTDLTAIATPTIAMPLDSPGEYPVEVRVMDNAEKMVFRAVVVMWISPKPVTA